VLELQVVVDRWRHRAAEILDLALSDYEKETATFLLCRHPCLQRITVELLNYDEDLLRGSIAVKECEAVVTKVSQLTHDITLSRKSNSIVRSSLAGQYVDLTIQARDALLFHGQRPRRRQHARIHHQEICSGAFSAQLDGGLKPGDKVRAKGPYGTCFRRERPAGPDAY